MPRVMFATATNVWTTVTCSDNQDDTWRIWCDASAATATDTWVTWNVDYLVAANQQAGIAHNAAVGMGYGAGANNAAGEWRAVCEQEERQQRQEAEKRARELLLASLDESQAEEFKLNRRFVVHSKDGVRTYLVTWGTAGNIYELENGQRMAKYCIHPTQELPVPDVMLAQKLMIETDESLFRKVANRTAVAA